MTKLSPEIRKHLAKRASPAEIAMSPFEIVDEIANGTVDDDTISARLVCWIAAGMSRLLYRNDEENWPLFTAFAEMAVTLMLAQHYATNKALSTTTQNEETAS